MVVITKVNIKTSQEYKLEKTLISKFSKIEYKSSSVPELEGGLYHKPMYTFSLTLFVLNTETRDKQYNPTTMSVPITSNTFVSRDGDL